MRPAGTALTKRAAPKTATVAPMAETDTPKELAYSGSTGMTAPKPS